MHLVYIAEKKAKMVVVESGKGDVNLPAMTRIIISSIDKNNSIAGIIVIDLKLKMITGYVLFAKAYFLIRLSSHHDVVFFGVFVIYISWSVR